MRHVIKGHPIVRVQYVPDRATYDPRRSLAEPEPHGYSFIWPETTKPPLGSYAMDDESPYGGGLVCVIAHGTDYEDELRTLSRLVPGNAITEAEQRDAAVIANARRAMTGESIQGVPPSTGTAVAAAADEYARWWWHVAKMAEEAGAADAKQIKAVGKHWYMVRDQQLGAHTAPTPTRSGKPPASTGYGASYDSGVRMIVEVRPSKPPVSAAKVTAAVLTCGLSLPFTRGIRKRK